MQRKTWWIRTHAAREHAIAERRRRAKKVVKRLSKPPLVERMASGLKPAIALIDAKRFADAREFVADFLEKNPKHVIGHAVLIRIHGLLGEADASGHLFNYCRHAGMECADIYCAMVDAYATCGEFQKALEIMAEAAGNGMDDIRSYVSYMSGLYLHGKYREIEVFHSSIPQKHREKAPIMVKYADALRKMKRYGEAVDIATTARNMRGALGNRTMAIIVIAYCEMERGNPGKAYAMLNEIYIRLSEREDGGSGFRFFPRLLCGMVFACKGGGIPQPESRIDEWRRQLSGMMGAGRGKTSGVENALAQLDEMPRACRQAVI